MKKTRVAIIGYGVVGKAQEKLFGKENCVIHDPILEFNNRDKVNNSCNVAFVCVPTPMNKDGSCNISIVDETVSWLKTPIIVIRSTIVPGTIDYLSKKYNKDIVFQPEYLGETPNHFYSNQSNKDFVILGGKKKTCSEVSTLLQKFVSPQTRFYFSDSKTVELCKYMENSYLATKVTFCNEFYEIAKKLEVDYNELRELWLADSRIEKSHTFVYPENRGFGGKCLPKDVNALFMKMKNIGYTSIFLKNILELNKIFRKNSNVD